MKEKDTQYEEQESGNRMSHENAEEHSGNTVPTGEAPLPRDKSKATHARTILMASRSGRPQRRLGSWTVLCACGRRPIEQKKPPAADASDVRGIAIHGASSAACAKGAKAKSTASPPCRFGARLIVHHGDGGE